VKFGFPLVLTSRVALSSAVDGYIAFDAANLQTPNREAFVVDEIRFHADLGLGIVDNAPPLCNYNPPFQNDGGLNLEIKMRVGPYTICESIPLWALSSSRDFTLEGGSWRFPLARPMFIPSGVGFVALARLVGKTVAGSLSYPQPLVSHQPYLSATLVGRVVTGDFPRTTNVPYISAYKPDAQVQGQSFLSLETDLDNPLNKDLELRYGIGRMGHLRRTGGVAKELYIFDCADVRLACNCRMALGNRPIIQHQSEFNVSFDPCTRVLGLGGLTLGGGERLTFQADAPVYATTTADAWAPVVSFIADRKENV
jgi:hypothetical protein